MKLAEDRIEGLRLTGIIHDIGKIGISNEILDKKGKLTAEERTTIQDHPRLGVRILEPIGAFTDILRIVQQHHENFDGSGYPDKLSGEDISEYSRIFAVADRYEALTSDRPYRKAIDSEKAVEYLKNNAGTQFDPKVVDAFLNVLKNKYSIPLVKSGDRYSEYPTRSPK